MTKTFLLPLALLSFCVSVARADQVGISAFGAPSVSTAQFNQFGNSVTLQNSPLTLGIATYSSSSYIAVFSSTAGGGDADCQSGCVTGYASYTLHIALDQAYSQFGLYVGQALPYDVLVSFYDASNELLASFDAIGTGTQGGSTFEGLADVRGIQSVTLSASPNGYDIESGSLYVTPAAAPTPEPGSVLLATTGALGMAFRRFRG